MVLSNGSEWSVLCGVMVADESTKRVVRKRVKRGTFSQPRSTGSTSWPKMLLSSRRGQATGSNLAAGNGISSNAGATSRRDPKMSTVSRQAVTFGGVEERSILREMDLLEERGDYTLPGTDSRRGSGKDSVDTKTTGASGVSGLSVASGGLSQGTDGTNEKVPGEKEE